MNLNELNDAELNGWAFSWVIAEWVQPENDCPIAAHSFSAVAVFSILCHQLVHHPCMGRWLLSWQQHDCLSAFACFCQSVCLHPWRGACDITNRAAPQASLLLCFSSFCCSCCSFRLACLIYLGTALRLQLRQQSSQQAVQGVVTCWTFLVVLTPVRQYNVSRASFLCRLLLVLPLDFCFVVPCLLMNCLSCGVPAAAPTASLGGGLLDMLGDISLSSPSPAPGEKH